MTTSKRRSGSEGQGGEESKLMKLFTDGLKDIYWVEKTLSKAIPKMIKKVSSPELAEALESHLSETEAQQQKLEQVFETVGVKPAVKKCEAMAGIIKEGERIIKESEAGPMMDAGIISAVQKAEHYEIASYGTLRAFADSLGISNAASILEAILEEEKAADVKLTEIAMSTVNMEAAELEEVVELDEEEEE